MTTYAFAVGLILRRGDQLLDFRRQLDERNMQFEDRSRGQIYTWSIDKVYREINNGELSVYRGDTPPPESILAKGKPTIEVLACLESLPSRRKNELERRMDYINAARKQGLTKGRRIQIVRVIQKVASRRSETPPSVSTVMAWWRKLDGHDGNPGALVSGYLNRKRAKSLPQDSQELIRKVLKSEFFTRDRHPLSRSHVLINRALQGSGESEHVRVQPVSLSTVRRIANEVGPYYRDRARFGPAYARNKWRYSLSGPATTRALQRVEVDHTILDLVVVCDRTGMPLGKPTITVIIDSYSGYVISFFVSFWGTGLGPTLNAMKIAISPKDSYCNNKNLLTHDWMGYGIFELAVVDNGLEFHSPQFQLAAWHLNADIQYCAVRQPWLKPSVERAMGSVGRSLPATGRVHKPISNYLPPNPKDTATITFSQLCFGLLKYFVDVHPFEVNARTLIEPFELFRESFESLPPPLLPSSFKEIELIGAMSKQLNVGNEGVVFAYLRYNSVELQNLRRTIATTFKTFVKFHPEDLGLVYVQNPLDKTWLPVPSCLSHYTSNLSYVQHRAIRNHLGKQLTGRRAAEMLAKGKLELIELYEGFSRGNRGKKNVKAAQQFGTLTSAQTLTDTAQHSSHPLEAPQLVVTTDFKLNEAEVPTFSSFQLD
jgi:putative transposase